MNHIGFRENLLSVEPRCRLKNGDYSELRITCYWANLFPPGGGPAHPKLAEIIQFQLEGVGNVNQGGTTPIVCYILLDEHGQEVDQWGCLIQES